MVFISPHQEKCDRSFEQIEYFLPTDAFFPMLVEIYFKCIFHIFPIISHIREGCEPSF